MDLGLQGCTAIVTGASSGIGLATAMSLAGEGCNVTVFARRGDRLAMSVAAIDALATGARGLAVIGDSREPADLQRAFDETIELFGRLDILVNNTGGPPAGKFDDLGEDAWRTAWELTLMSTLRMSRIALPALRASGRGRIVNITSSTVKEPNEDLLLSNVYRPGVIGWAKTLSQDEGPNGITVNSVAPGFIDTDRLKEIYAGGDDPAGSRAAEEGLIPVRRFGEAREVADAITFLCSTRAAYITGVTLLVDGGVARGLLS
jgi:3-oxoacyl-[acyl-carrier protein] reductase